MQKIKPLLDRASRELESASNESPTGVGPNRRLPDSAPAAGDETVKQPAGDADGNAAVDHVDAINQVFAEFEFAYHNQFHKAFADPESLAIAKQYWLSSLERYGPAQIVQAAKKVIRTQDYLPSIAVILSFLCINVHGIFGNVKDDLL